METIYSCTSDICSFGKGVYDRVPMDLIWWSSRKKGIPEHVAIIQDMYQDTNYTGS